jgi:hypothetical protein
VSGGNAAAALRCFLWCHLGLRHSFSGIGYTALSLSASTRAGKLIADVMSDVPGVTTGDDTSCGLRVQEHLAMGVHLLPPGQYKARQLRLATEAAERAQRRADKGSESDLTDSLLAASAAADAAALADAEADDQLPHAAPTPSLPPMRVAGGSRFEPVLAPAVTVDLLPVLRPMVAAAIAEGDSGGGTTPELNHQHAGNRRSGSTQTVLFAASGLALLGMGIAEILSPGIGEAAAERILAGLARIRDSVIPPKAT